MLLPALANWLAPVSPVTIGLTAVMVMAVPMTAIVEADTRFIVQRAAHRVIGCLLGALLGLACLAIVGSDFAIWTVLLLVGVWLCSQIQTGTTGISYIGTQAMFAFAMSLVGVVAGLSLLFVITLVLSLISISQPATPAVVRD